MRGEIMSQTNGGGSAVKHCTYNDVTIKTIDILPWHNPEMFSSTPKCEEVETLFEGRKSIAE